MSRDLARKLRLNEDEAAAKLPKMNPVMVQWRLRRPAFASTLDLQVIELVCVIHRQETLPRSNLNRTHDAKALWSCCNTRPAKSAQDFQLGFPNTEAPDFRQTFEQQN